MKFNTYPNEHYSTPSDEAKDYAKKALEYSKMKPNTKVNLTFNTPDGRNSTVQLTAKEAKSAFMRYSLAIVANFPDDF